MPQHQTKKWSDLPLILTPQDVMTLTGLSDRTVYRLLDEGTIPAVRAGRQWLIHRDNFEKFLLNTAA